MNTPPNAKEDRPGSPLNILWICTDQQRWDALGAIDNSWVDTPNLDRLAQEGVLFEHAYCNNPVCMPSRSSFLTGCYPRSAGVGFNGVSLPECHYERLLPRQLANAGYHNGLAGKLHLTQNPLNPQMTESIFNHGYHEFYWSPGGNPQRWAACEYQHWLRDKEIPFVINPHPDSKHVELGMPAEHHQVTWCAQRAITFMEAMADVEMPWMFSCNLFDPHEPFDPPADLLRRYEERLSEIPLPNYEPGELDNKPSIQQKAHRSVTGSIMVPIEYDKLPPQEHRLIRAAYWAMVDLIDQQVGRMLDTLDATGQRDNTLVIFMSDHGESLGDHGIYKKGFWFYDESMRVPLIMSCPGEKARRNERQKGFAELVDLTPTILQAAGLDIPDWVEGKSWWSYLNGGDPVDREHVFADLHAVHSGHETSMLRTQEHKIVYRYDTEEGELYDFADEHSERYNRWDEQAYAETRSRLMAALDARRTGHPPAESAPHQSSDRYVPAAESMNSVVT